MTISLQYDLLISRQTCRCGGRLIFDGRFYMCPICFRHYCPECFGYIVAEGGCFSCINCGWSVCG